MKKILIFTFIFVIIFSSVSFANSYEDLPPFPIDLYELACDTVNSSNPYYLLYKFNPKKEYQLAFFQHSNVYQTTEGWDYPYVRTREDNYVALFKLGESGWYQDLTRFVPAGENIGFSPLLNSVKLNSNFTIYDEQMTTVYFPYNPLPSNFFTVPPHKVVEMGMRGVIPDLVGKTLTILPVGFGLVLATLLIVLLVDYFKRYLLRSI